MKLGFIGLGKMGLNMSLRLIEKGHEIIGYARSLETRQKAASAGISTLSSIEELIQKLPQPRIIWVMVPSGPSTDEVFSYLSSRLNKGDIIIDGGNSYYKDSIVRGNVLKEKNILFLDVGVSGGVWGRKEGYCMMVGGDSYAFKIVEPLFKDLTNKEGYEYLGKNGSGHFVKMIHNGIEYALLQAYAEGFEILKEKKGFDFDLKKIAHLWNKGSVIRSWLLELSERAFDKEKDLSSVEGYVDDSGEGRWTVLETIENAIPAPTIVLSLMQRFASRQKESFSAKYIAALREQFGGHSVKKKS
jgi:6-phosphogluconate dehydrogenase